MKRLGAILKAAAAVSLLVAALSPEPIMLLVVLSMVLMAAGWLVGSSVFAAGEAEKDKAAERSSRMLLIGRISIGVLGVVFIFHGIMNGGMRAVLLKAVRICMECIGLG